MKKRFLRILSLSVCAALALMLTACDQTPATSTEDSDVESSAESSEESSKESIGIAPEDIQILTGGEVFKVTTEETSQGTVSSYEAQTAKRGIAASMYGGGGKTQLSKLSQLGVSWYYNWGNNGNSTDTMEFVPMVWSDGSISVVANQIKKKYEMGLYKNLLTFNEPDLQEQSNMTVERALAAWPKLQEIGIRLGSPCPASSGNYTSGWLAEFMKGCEERGYRVDFIAVHCYQDVVNVPASQLVTQLKDFLTSIYDKYQLPIWLTEFGAIDMATWGGAAHSPNYNEQKSLEFMKQASEMMEELGFVERYSFFLDDYGGGTVPTEGRFSRLFANGERNAMGEAYAAVDSAKALLVQTTSLPTCVNGTAYSGKVVVSGGDGNYTFSAENLPTGLSINAKTGEITGTPTGGSGKAIIRIKDGAGQTTHVRYAIADRSDLKLEAYDPSGFKAYYAEFLNKDPWFTDHEVSEVVDGKTGTTYTLPRAQTANDGVYVMFGEEIEVEQLKIVGTSASELPQQYKLLMWVEGASWQDCSYTASKEGSTLTLQLDDTVTTSRLFVQLTGNSSANWSMSEMTVYGYQ